MNRYFPIIILSLIIITLLFSCIGTAPTREKQYIDSLNQLAYSYRYKNLDSSFQAARTAYEESSLYKLGKAEACNNLGFSAFMQMNFDAAERLFKEVYELTKNELELLIADVGLMKIYQRTAMNKEFYDFRNSAIQRIKRIDEDRSLFIEPHEKRRMNFAFTEYSIVSAIYYFYLQQVPEALKSINEIKPDLELQNDTNQILYYHYIKGSASLTGEESLERRLLNEFDELYKTWNMASQGGYLYFEGNGLQGLANLMIPADNFDFLLDRRSHALTQFGLPVDSLLPMELARIALRKFREYNDIYQIAGAYVSIGKYLNEHGHYQEALDTLTKALDYVNYHHQLYYSDPHNEDDILKTYVEERTIYTEISWITGLDVHWDGNTEIAVKTVPEWISRIREQLSVSYAGLGMKAQSDYNRDIYIYILDFTRQNKEFESRFFLLKHESKQLNIWLMVVLSGILSLILLFWIFNTHARRRNQVYISRLELTLDICQKITSSIPADVKDEDDMVQAILAAIREDMRTLIGIVDMDIILDNSELTPVSQSDGVHSIFPLYVPENEQRNGTLELITIQKLSKDQEALINVIAPYIAWTLDNGMISISLDDEREKLEKEKYIFEQHIAKNKRENIIKKACLAIVNGIVPYIDRILNEIFKLREKGFIRNEKIKKEKYQYIDELVTTINEYNDILALWIKMKQGSLSLNIENFSLNELFSLVKKGRKTFEMKNQAFDVEPTTSIIKADKALTLFMINTLTENARKYTQEGGEIKVYARSTDQYVEISVEDNGRGLSPEDVARIKDENIYDSRSIGMGEEEVDKELKKLKGSGFGLMNCKGIIEKYKKTNRIFDACLFSVESTLGKGSRFFFRLPVGIQKKMIIFLCLFLPYGISSCHKNNQSILPPTNDSILPGSIIEHSSLLKEAALYVDTAHFCNVTENYELALEYIDASINYLNQHYKKYSFSPQAYMQLVSNDIPAELIWWNEPYETEYDIVMDVRNEAAISFLALKRWDAYTYNNKAFTALYKLYHEDLDLEAVCLELERSTTNKMVAIVLCILLLVTSLIGYYIFYMRKRQTDRWNLEQVLEINKHIFSSAIIRIEESAEALQKEENALKEVPREIVSKAFTSVNELIAIDFLGLAVFNASTNKLEFASYPHTGEIPEMVTNSFRQQYFLMEDKKMSFPLIVDAGNKHQCVGVFYIEKQDDSGRETDRLLLELISRYVAVVVFNAVIKLAMRYRDIESAFEDTHRASWEDNMLHVQNMVLDNCLSTIKHETIYYPNKIKQIIKRLSEKEMSLEEEQDNIESISELIDYYKGIFTILSSCASRQLEEVTFRRTSIPIQELLKYAEKYFQRHFRNMKANVSFRISNQAGDHSVIGDINQLNFLFENLLNESLTHPLDGTLKLDTAVDDKFIRFIFTDTRRNKSLDELNQLFYPDLQRMTAGEKGELKETEFLVCKQIIRDHDEYSGRRGCRIIAEPAPEDGFSIYFTIPKR